MQPKDFDYFQLRRELVAAARQSFAALRSAHRDERFYAFALYSDDRAMGVLPAANTEEGLERTRAKYGAGVPREDDYLRWGTGEWAYECHEADSFNGICDLLFAAPDEIADEDLLRSHCGLVFEQMVAALGDLQDEGFFGLGEERRAVTLFCTITDSFDAVALERESARRLNGSLPTGPYWR